MKNCLGIINLDENDIRMGDLVHHRSLASVPIAGRYRIIDFVLSNMANSGIEGIGIFTKNKSRSLVNHLTNGRPWDLHRKKHGLRVFNFGDRDPQYDDVHNFAENIEFIKQSRKEYVLLSSSNMICNIDYSKAIKQHIRSRRDITMIYKNTDEAELKYIDCNVLNMDDNNRVKSIGENLGTEKIANISMEMYIMRIDIFIDMIYDCIKSGLYRKIKDCIKNNLDVLNVGAYEFTGYLGCINSLQTYFDINMELLNQDVNNELFYDKKPIFTKSQDESPTQYTPNSLVSNSIVANGSYIEGIVRNSIIGRRVHIAAGAVVENCIVMQNSVIETGVKMEKVVADKGTVVRQDQKIISTENNPITIQKVRSV